MKQIGVGNIHEKRCVELLEEMGYTVQHGGWPDFVAFGADGKIIAVEAKGPNDRLQKNQKKVLQILISYGIPCFKWTPEAGLQQITDPERTLLPGRPSAALPEVPVPPPAWMTLESLKPQLQALEYQHILGVLTAANGNKTKAAKMLGISYRTLLYKITDLNSALRAEGLRAASNWQAPCADA